MKDEVSCLFYGERGIINAILFDIGKDKDKLTNDLLNRIVYSDGITKEFSSEDIKSVQFLLEGTFGQFGAPDLMIRADLKSQGSVFFIIEAKVKEFSKECAVKENGKYCFTGKSGSRNCASLINIQLALRARFMKAWKTKADKIVRENSHDEQDGDKYINGRALEDKYALELLENFFGEDVIYTEKSALPENVYYVSLTSKYDVNSDIEALKCLLLENNDDFISRAGFLNYDAFISGDYPHFRQAGKYNGIV